MGRVQALSLAGFLVLGSVSVVHAADLLPPAPQLPPYAAPLEVSGWYLRGDVGVGIASLRSVTSTFNAPVPDFALDESHLDDSAFVGLGVGYQFNNWFRADLTGEYRTSQRFQSIESYGIYDYNNVPPNRVGTGFDTYNGSIQSSVFLVNGYIDLGHWYGWTPYVGGGVGVAYHRVESLSDVGAGSTYQGAGNGGLGWAPNKSNGAFAWALMAGVSFDVTPNLKLDISYRYLDMGDAKSGVIACTTPGCVLETQKYHLASNDIRFGLRWMLEPPPPPPPPPPIVTKY